MKHKLLSVMFISSAVIGCFLLSPIGAHSEPSAIISINSLREPLVVCSTEDELTDTIESGHMVMLTEIEYRTDVQETWINSEYVQYANEIGETYGICPELIISMIETESSGRPEVVSASGTCKGLMQVNDNVHASRMNRLNVTNIYDPYSNILVGVDYLYELFEEYEDVGVVLMRYNGDSRYDQEGYLSNYAQSILERSNDLEELHHGVTRVIGYQWVSD